MNYSKYNKEAFEKISNEIEATKKLACELQNDVLKELHHEVLKSFKKVVSNLNDEGHSLMPYVENIVGDYAYRDTNESGGCSLRLSCDVIISSGFNDIINET